MKSVVKSVVRRMAGKDARRQLELRKLQVEKFIYRKPVHIGELREGLQSLGHWRNRIIYVQSSWNQFYNVKLKPLELIDMMLDLAGPEGTVVMPTHPLVVDYTALLKIDEVPSASGLLTELFRRKRGAKRSIHVGSAVSALGPAADALTSEHHLDMYSWGAKSPFGKMVEADALLLLMGTVPMGFTPLHFVECALHGKLALFDGVFGPTLTYPWVRKDGTAGEHTFYRRNGLIRPGVLKAHYGREIYRARTLSNLSLQAMDAKAGIERALELAKAGITIYPHLPRA